MGDRAAVDDDFARPGRLSRLRWRIWLGLALAAGMLVFWMASRGSPGDLADRPVLLTTAATLLGPFAGAVARHGQGCCLAFSVELLEFACGPALAVGLLLQVVPLPRWLDGRPGEVARLVAWSLGWSAWFLGGPASFLHALV